LQKGRDEREAGKIHMVETGENKPGTSYRPGGFTIATEKKGNQNFRNY